MKKALIIIPLLISFLMIVIHEIIPHHHHELEAIEFFSHHHDNNNQDDHSDSDADHNSPFSAHQHISVAENFEIVRTNQKFEISINLKLLCYNPIASILWKIHNSEPPGNVSYSVLKLPLSSFPFIISPNAMRGSPSIA